MLYPPSLTYILYYTTTTIYYCFILPFLLKTQSSHFDNDIVTAAGSPRVRFLSFKFSKIRVCPHQYNIGTVGRKTKWHCHFVFWLFQQFLCVFYIYNNMNDSKTYYYYYYYTYTLYLSYNENIQQFSGIREWVIQIYRGKIILHC